MSSKSAYSERSVRVERKDSKVARANKEAMCMPCETVNRLESNGKSTGENDWILKKYSA